MRGCWVVAWHPDSPGVRVTVWRPWWRRKAAEFATLGEMTRGFLGKVSNPGYRPKLDVTEPRPSWPRVLP